MRDEAGLILAAAPKLRLVLVLLIVLDPLGYEVHDRPLVVADSEAETVRHIFQRYCELGSVRLLHLIIADPTYRTRTMIVRFPRLTVAIRVERSS